MVEKYWDTRVAEGRRVVLDKKVVEDTSFVEDRRVVEDTNFVWSVALLCFYVG